MRYELYMPPKKKRYKCILENPLQGTIPVGKPAEKDVAVYVFVEQDGTVKIVPQSMLEEQSLTRPLYEELLNYNIAEQLSVPQDITLVENQLNMADIAVQDNEWVEEILLQYGLCLRNKSECETSLENVQKLIEELALDKSVSPYIMEMLKDYAEDLMMFKKLEFTPYQIMLWNDFRDNMDMHRRTLTAFITVPA